MAAVKAMGISTCTSKESAKALSSSVSVPWVITMPTPDLAAAVAASAIAAMSASVKFGFNPGVNRCCGFAKDWAGLNRHA
jgi:hypothetical protein